MRFSRADTDGVENLGGWLTTIVGRVCLDQLRSRSAAPARSRRRPSSTPSGRVGGSSTRRTRPCWPTPSARRCSWCSTRLAPAERLAFVLHDLFAVPFDEIAPIVGRSPVAARQLASRARRRVQGRRRGRPRRPGPPAEVVDAFLAASRGGDFDALLAVLDPDVELRPTPSCSPPGCRPRPGGPRSWPVGPGLPSRSPHGADVRIALVDGAVGVVTVPTAGWRWCSPPPSETTESSTIDIIAEPERLARLELVAGLNRSGLNCRCSAALDPRRAAALRSATSSLRLTKVW